MNGPITIEHPVDDRSLMVSIIKFAKRLKVKAQKVKWIQWMDHETSEASSREIDQ